MADEWRNNLQEIDSRLRELELRKLELRKLQDQGALVDALGQPDTSSRLAALRQLSLVALERNEIERALSYLAALKAELTHRLASLERNRKAKARFLQS